MALTTAQRNKLPKSAFVYSSGPRSNWKYPVPTKTQAAKAGISETSRQKTLNAAKSYSARSDTSGSPGRVKAVVKKRKTR
jgi:3,4-dihydroxy-2-butanone 4-phosphate synthase